MAAATTQRTSRRHRRRRVVFAFDEGTPATLTPKIRGGKGVNLAEMAAIGLPVPPGFTVSTTVARAFSETKELPKRFAWQFRQGIARLERTTGREFGNADNPLLLSVRSGAAASMPGMMDTVLNVGLNPAIVRALAQRSGERFVWDTYRRFLATFGQVVLEVPGELFESFLANVKRELGVQDDSELSAETLMSVCMMQRALIACATGSPVPDDPFEQLTLAATAVLRSWTSERAVAYRLVYNLPNWWGTAINVQAMVFGNRDDDSGTGVVFSHDVVTGQPGLYGEFLPNAQGEDVVAGVRTPRSIAEMAKWAPTAYRELRSHVSMLSEKFDDIVDVEFTVESGRLYLLQVRRAKRTPLAAATFAVHQVWDKKWPKKGAVTRVSDVDILRLRQSTFETEAFGRAAQERLLARGLAASPGAATGVVVFSCARAQELAAAGEQVVLVKHETSPGDLPGMLKAAAIVTFKGGATCHAAVVARELGLPAVVGAVSSVLKTLAEGQVVSVDGTTGTIVFGEVPLVAQNATKEVNIFLRWVERHRRYEPRIGFEWIKKLLSANQMLNDFYLVDAMSSKAIGTRLEAQASALRTRLHRELAECLVAYLTIAVAGELRHFYSACRASEDTVCRLEDQFGLQCGVGRVEAQKAALQKLEESDRAAQIDYFRLLVEVYGNGKWDLNYGGSSWRRIAQAALDFLEGTLSPSVFVDHVFDLRHNGGRLFDKHPMLSYLTKEDSINYQLEEKRCATNLRDLYGSLANYGFGPAVSAMWQQGTENGLW